MKLFTINVGNLDYAKYSMPFIKKLCDENGIEFVCLDKDISQNKYGLHPSWLKLFAHELYNDNFIIWWDLDLVPCKMYDIKHYFDDINLNFSYDSSYLKESFVFNRKFKYNCGFAGIPKSYSQQLQDIYVQKGVDPKYPSYEQYYVNDWIYDNNVYVNILPEKLNRRVVIDADVEEDTLNIHYSHIDRFKLIKEHYEKYEDALNG